MNQMQPTWLFAQGDDALTIPTPPLPTTGDN